jgi:hypothetical protein
VERRDTRARSKLIIVGDEDVWAERGGIGGELLREASSVVGSVPAQPVGHSEDDVQRLYEVLSVLDIGEVELGITVHGHRADAVVRSPDRGSPRPVLLDTGPADGITPAHTCGACSTVSPCSATARYGSPPGDSSTTLAGSHSS